VPLRETLNAKTGTVGHRPEQNRSCIFVLHGVRKNMRFASPIERTGMRPGATNLQHKENQCMQTS